MLQRWDSKLTFGTQGRGVGQGDRVTCHSEATESYEFKKSLVGGSKMNWMSYCVQFVSTMQMGSRGMIIWDDEHSWNGSQPATRVLACLLMGRGCDTICHYQNVHSPPRHLETPPLRCGNAATGRKQQWIGGCSGNISPAGRIGVDSIEKKNLGIGQTHLL